MNIPDRDSASCPAKRGPSARPIPYPHPRQSPHHHHTDALGHSSTVHTDTAGRALLTEDAVVNLAGAAYDANSNRILTTEIK